MSANIDHKKRLIRKAGLFLAACLILLAALPVIAQSGEGFELGWHIVAGGGGMFSTGGGYSLGGTIGQHGAGQMLGNGFSLGGGFWVGDVAETNNDPTDIQLSNSTVAEGLPINTLVGVLTTSDSNLGDSFTYALVNGDGDTDNDSFNILDDQLRTSAVFDYAVQNSYAVRIRTTDQGGLSLEKAFTIQVVQAGAPVFQYIFPIFYR